MEGLNLENDKNDEPDKQSPLISMETLNIPFLIFKDGIKTQYKLRLFSGGPYKPGKGRKVKILSIINGNSSEQLEQLKAMLKEYQIQKILSPSCSNIDIVGSVPPDCLIKNIHLYKDSLLLILHDGNLNGIIHDQIKLLAKRNDVRVQFINISHLGNSTSVPFKGVITQIIAKDDGIPWILDIEEDDKAFYPNSIIIGISYSSKYSRLSYGVAHFIDILNMDEKIELLKGILRTDSYRGVLLRDDEFKNIIEEAIKWYKFKNPKASDFLHIFFYETAPIRENNIRLISDLINDPSKIGLSKFEFTHINIKSTNYGTPRIYDTSNVGYDPKYTYMQQMGTCIKIQTQAKGSSFCKRGEAILGTTGFYIQDINTPKGTKGTPLPLYCQITSNTQDAIETVARQVMKLAHLDWEFLFQEYRSPFMIKYSTKLASLINQFCSKEQELTDFPTLWDVRDLM